MHDLTLIELWDAMSRPGCAICRVAALVSRRYIRSFLHEYVLDSGMRVLLRASRGFCPRHAWQCQRLEQEIWHDGLSTATVYEDLLNGVIARIEKASSPGAEDRRRPRVVARLRGGRDDGALDALAQGLSWTSPCPACRSEREMVETACWALADALADGDERTRSAYAAAAPFCLDHFAIALGQAGSPDVRTALVRTQLGKMRQLSREIAEYIRKHDVRFQREPKGEEQTSWVRVVELFAGLPAGEASAGDAGAQPGERSAPAARAPEERD